MASAVKVREERRNHYAEVTEKIIAAIEAGTPPWRRDWDRASAASISGYALPCNAISRRPYRGINRLVLGMDSRVVDSGDPRFLTFEQSRSNNWNVRRGEKSSMVFFYKTLELDEVDKSRGGDEKRRIPFLRAIPVFHASQVIGIPDWSKSASIDPTWKSIDAVDVISKNFGIQIDHHGEQAYYAAIRDRVVVPPKAAFSSAEGYSATLLHELSHASAHSSRLNRYEALQNRFGDKMYSIEELRAELSSAYICGTLGINSSLKNHSSYLSSWIEVLRSDHREIFRTAAEAQKIADYVLEKHPEYAKSAEAERQADMERATARDVGRDQLGTENTPVLPPAHLVASAAKTSSFELER